MGVKSVTSYVNDTAAASHEVPYPTVAEGDLILVVWLVPEAWTAVGWDSVEQTPSGNNFGVLSKTALGSESGSFTVTATGTTRRAAFTIIVIEDWVEFAVSLLTDSTEALTPPSVTASWGSAENLWLAIGGGRATNWSFTAGPTGFANFTNTKNETNTSTARYQTAVAYKTETTATVTPDAFEVTDNTDPDYRQTSGLIVVRLSASTAGITITDIKEANEADELVTGVSNASVKVWYGVSPTGNGAEDELIANQSITAGTMTVELSSASVGDSFIATWVREVSTGVFRYGRATGTVVDLSA